MSFVMDQACIVEIRVKGQLTERWSEWFDGLAIQADCDGTTTLCGRLADQAALLGLLNRLHALNLTLLSFVQVPG
jgi:hypothetical protein